MVSSGMLLTQLQLIITSIRHPFYYILRDIWVMARTETDEYRPWVLQREHSAVSCIHGGAALIAVFVMSSGRRVLS